jgi:fructoselysine-6-P-deglycase FrlB-like protein
MDTPSLDVALSESLRYPLVAVGSGGSLSAAYFVCHLHQQFAGKIAKASTPLEILSLLSDGGSRHSLVNSAALCLSAGGSNADINRAFRALIETEPRHLLALCARRGSPLAKIASKYDYVSLIDFGLPSRKDGFLATNSLLAFIVLLARSYSQLWDDVPALPSTLWRLLGKYENLDSALGDLRHKLRPLLEREHLVVLHGAGTKAAAYDIESKFIEAALGSVQLSDYRNFAHGRHHWLAKRNEMSAVIALAEDGDITLAKRTANLLPSSVPSVVLQFSGAPISSSIAAVVTGFLVTAVAGEIRGIDPGRPCVPQFGRRLYHLGIGNIGINGKREKAPIQRKSDACASSSSEMLKAYTVFTRSLGRMAFSGLVLDYDGTLCGAENRFAPLDQQIAKELVRLLRAGIPVGIATGRGKSVRKSLQQALPKVVWKRLIVGYYNGAECNPLSDSSAPDGTDKACLELEAAVDVLSSDSCLKSLATITIRKKQISLEPKQIRHIDALWKLASGRISRLSGTGIKVVMSAHSIDVLAPGVSKRNVVDAIPASRSERSHTSVLCIGDQGKWPGNDSELLSEAHALSVDTVSSDLNTCWNIAPAGYRGPQAAMFYLKCLVPQEGQFRLQLDRGRRT